VENWLTKVVPKELARERKRHKLTAKQRQKGKTISIPIAEIARKLQEKDTQWYESAILNRTGLKQPMGIVKTLSISDGLSIEELGGEIFEGRRYSNTETMVEESNVSILEIISPNPSTMPNRYHMNKPHGMTTISSTTQANNTEIARCFLRDIAFHVERILSVEIPNNWLHPLMKGDRFSHLHREFNIPVEPSLRILRLKLMYQIRRFPFNGLLAPVMNDTIADDERFCNHHPECISTIPSRVFHHFVAMSEEERSEYFKPYTPPKCYMQRKLRIHPYRTESNTTLRQSYDRWYWNLFIACSIEMECDVPLRHVVDMVQKSVFMDTPETNVFKEAAHIHGMYDAKQRNTQLSEAPEWVWARNCQC
jgi:hypothetical protein